MLILNQEASKQLTSSMLKGDDACASSPSQCEQQNPWQWPVNKVIVILCVRVYDAIDYRAKLKAHQKYAQKTLDMGCLHKEKYLCKNFRFKEEGVCSKRVYFWEIIVHAWCSPFVE